MRKIVSVSIHQYPEEIDISDCCAGLSFFLLKLINKDKLEQYLNEAQLTKQTRHNIPHQTIENQHINKSDKSEINKLQQEYTAIINTNPKQKWPLISIINTLLKRLKIDTMKTSPQKEDTPVIAQYVQKYTKPASHHYIITTYNNNPIILSLTRDTIDLLPYKAYSKLIRPNERRETNRAIINIYKVSTAPSELPAE